MTAFALHYALHSPTVRHWLANQLVSFLPSQADEPDFAARTGYRLIQIETWAVSQDPSRLILVTYAPPVKRNMVRNLGDVTILPG